MVSCIMKLTVVWFFQYLHWLQVGHFRLWRDLADNSDTSIRRAENNKSANFPKFRKNIFARIYAIRWVGEGSYILTFFVRHRYQRIVERLDIWTCFDYVSAVGQPYLPRWIRMKYPIENHPFYIIITGLHHEPFFAWTQRNDQTHPTR